MSRLILVFLGLLFVNSIFAQICSTPQGPLLDRVERNMNTLQIQNRSAQKYIPVTFHLVARNDSTGRVAEEDVLRQLANLNVQFGDQEALFYIDRFNYMYSDAVFDNPGSSAATTLMRLRQDNNSLNLFITNTAEHGSETPGVTLAYYDPQEDWVVSRKAQINGTSSTIAHEFGHFFGLPHPHAGWDCKPYTMADYGNPVTDMWTLPCTTGGGSLPIELQDGSNCTSAGDKICDTPPDYNLGLLHQSNCAPNTTIKDKNGTIITPMTNNFMGYYTQCANYEFTPTQKNLINADFFSSQRLYIRTGKVPNQNPVTGPVNYITPINGLETPSPDNILLDWEDVPNADKYLVIVDRSSQFSIKPVRWIVDESEATIGGLLEGVTYYWRVYPYNESQTGAGFGATQNFRVGMGVGVNDITEIEEYSLSPNPASSGQESILGISSVKAFNAIMKVSDAAGHIVLTEALAIPSGFSQHIVRTKDLPSGIYFLLIYSESGILAERLIKSN